MNLLDLLRVFLRPGVDEPDPNADPADDPAPDADPAPDLEIDPDAPAPEDKKDAPSAEEFEAIRAAARADKERGDRYEREAADLRQRVAPQAPREDDITRQENDRLKDPAITATERWQIESNRVIRANEQRSNYALMQAQDVNDKTNFSRLAMTKPSVFKLYEDRVEKELQTMRSKGFNAPREQILQNLIGRDALEGKLKPKKAAAADAGADKGAVARGKLPGARSDISGKTKMSEHQKRAQRLENVQI